MSVSDPGLRRVCVHAGTVAVDVALPAAVPIASLIPSIIDILDSRGTTPFARTAAVRYQLSRPGLPAFGASTTLAQNDIRDGTVLVLNQPVDIPAPRWDDVAEAVSAALDTAAPRWSRPAIRVTGAVAAGCLTGAGCLALIRNAVSANADSRTAAVTAVAGFCALVAAVLADRRYREPIAGLTLGVVAAGFAAVAGLLAVPGPPGFPQVLLAAMTAASTSVLAMRLTGCGVVTFTALACFAAVVAGAALAGTITGAPLHVISAVAALLSLGLLETAARLSIALAGVSPQWAPPPDLAAKAVRADNWLTSLLAGFAASAAVGAVITALAPGGTARWGRITFAALIGALLLARAPSHPERSRTLMFVITGIVTAATVLVVVGTASSAPGPGIVAVTAVSAAAAIYLGFVAPGRQLSPVARRGVEVLECLILVALVPLTCWICGLFDSVRGLDLR